MNADDIVKIIEVGAPWIVVIAGLVFMFLENRK